jgi:outer membrane protein assembly factor BamB
MRHSVFRDFSTSLGLSASLPAGLFVCLLSYLAGSVNGVAQQSGHDPTKQVREAIADLKIGAKDCPQWQLSPLRNNVVESEKIPLSWNVETGENLRWSAKLGSETYGNPVIANGKVYVGTNNGAAYLKRYPNSIDLGVLLAFDEQTGKFLWQHSSEKLPTGRVHDWPDQGICSAPLLDGDKVWFVTSRGEVACLDAEGFHDGEDDGPFVNEQVRVAEVQRTEPAFAPMIAALDADQVSPEMTALLAKQGANPEGDVTVQVETAKSAWKLTSKFNGIERTLSAKVMGPRLAVFKTLGVDDKDEADVIWKLDMMKQLGVSQHNMCSCSLTCAGDLLFVNTSNGVDEGHVNLPAENAPSFVCLRRSTGEVLWTDNSPGANVLHGQWSSPAYAVIDGVPQVIFGAGDGWLYGFHAEGENGNSKLLWKFDCNPKTSLYKLTGADRNHLIGTPVIYNDLVYIAVGEDPEHGEGKGHLWCVDPRKRGDLSPTLVFNGKDPQTPIAHKRLKACVEDEGDFERPNPNIGAVWHYQGSNPDEFETTMHRTCGSVAIKNDLLFIADFSGVFHCIDAQTGEAHWTYDMLAAPWASPLIVNDRVYITNDTGGVLCFKVSSEMELLSQNDVLSAVYTTPVVANETLFIANRNRLYSIQEGAKMEPEN